MTRIVNLDSLQPQPRPAEFAPSEAPAAERYACSRAPLGAAIGAQQLGCNVTVIPPGKAAYPFHRHRVNEELFLVLAGTGELRLGDERLPLRAGDVFACPAGGPGHQIRNPGSAELRYLAISTKRSPEICDYPDSGKFGVYEDGENGFYFMGRAEQCLDYWDGEGST